MKTIIILILLVANLSFSQVTKYKIDDSISIEVDVTLYDSLDTLVKLFEANNLDKTKLGKICGIYRAQFGESVLGYTNSLEGTIKVTYSIPEYLPDLKTYVLYHEIGHILFGEIHDPNGPYIFRPGSLINIQSLIKYWDYYEHEYIYYLKQNL